MTPVTEAGTETPGYVAGTWDLDPVHTEVGFLVRHMMVSKVRGRFTDFKGTIHTEKSFLDSTVEVSVDLNSIDTDNEQRDDHLRSGDFFEIEKYPVMTFHSTGIRPKGEEFELDGELNLHGVTRPVTLALEINGFTKDPYGGTRSGFSAYGEISREDFGITFNMPMDGGGVVVGDKITINIEVEATLRAE